MNKKVIVFTVLATLILSQLGAQVDGRRFRVGILGTSGFAWNQSKRLGVENEGAGYLYGYGFQLEFYRNDVLGITFGLQQKTTGTRLSYADNLVYSYEYTSSNNGATLANQSLIKERTIFLQSINVPIKIKAKTPEIGYLTYFLEFGLDNDILYDAKSLRNDILDSDTKQLRRLGGDEEKLSAQKETFFYRGGLNLGFGTEYNLAGTVSLVTSINWSMPFTRSLKKDSYDVSWADENGLGSGNKLIQDIRTQRLFLTVGLLF